MLWDYDANGEAFLRNVADEADRQKQKLRLIPCKVREEQKDKRANLTNDEANKHNQNVLDYVKGIGYFIRNSLIEGRLTNDDTRLQPHEKLLGVMLCPETGGTAVQNAWKAKITKIFMDGYQDGVFTIDLQQIYESLCIKNPINPSDNKPLILTGAQAYKLKLTISHKHHLVGASIIYDCNPNNFEFDNQADNNAKKSCSYLHWLRACQCTHQCHPRLELLDEKRYENEVIRELLMIGGLFPSDGEIEIREKIRDAFIQHHQRNHQAPPDYLSDENKTKLMEPKYPHFEGLRPRFDLNAAGEGMYCSRQGCYVTWKQILMEEKYVPKGLLDFLNDTLKQLTPVDPPRVEKLKKDDEYDRSVPGQRKSQDDAITENLYQFQRVLAIGVALRYAIEGKFIFNHPGMAEQEGSVNTLLHDGVLGENQQTIQFTLNTGGLRNTYLENESKTSFNVNIARLLKTVQIYIDHHNKWLELDGGGTEFANPQVLVKHTSISNPPRTVLTPQQAHSQLLHASHDTHPESTRYTDPNTPQAGGEARDANPDNTNMEPEIINVHRGICSARPDLPSRKMCTCHPTYPCAPVLHKLDERYINDNALVQWLLGDNGRFPKMSIQDIRKKLIAEVRKAYECQGVTVPPFIKVLELLPENVVFPEYPCQNCGQGKAHLTLAEVKACGQQQPPAADQDNRVVVDYKDIKENDNYLGEIVGLIKDWGWGKWTIIWKRATLFKANDRLCSGGTTKLTDKSYTSSPIKKYCGRKQIDFELLTECSGIKFGCLCNLH